MAAIRFHLRQQKRILPIALALLAITWPSSMLTGDEKPLPVASPEIRYVAVASSFLHSGPGDDFYATGMMNRGDSVEVYQRTQDGWLGIRPPEGSFSWVPASQAFLLPGGRVIEITQPDSVSWIGSELGTAKQYRWQVQLNRGEQLSVLGEERVSNGSEDRQALWYKVAPPAGEFRWIKEDATTLQAPPPTQESTSSVMTAASETDGKAKSNLKKHEVVTASSVADRTVVDRSIVEGGNQKPRGRQNKAIASGQLSTAQQSTSDWSGWYALEWGEQGLRSPFLDMLNGRQPTPAAVKSKPMPPPKLQPHRHDPLLKDPFSLDMATSPAVTPAQAEAPVAAANATADPDQPSQAGRDLSVDVRHNSGWRDPRQLRQQRIALRDQKSLPRLDRASDLDDGISSRLNSLAGYMSSLSGEGYLEKDNTGKDKPGEVQSAAFSHAAPPSPPLAAAQTPAWHGLGSGSPSSGTERLAPDATVGELNIALGQMMAESTRTGIADPSELEQLESRTRQLIEHGSDAIERGQARLLMDRIVAFRDLNQRSLSLATAAPTIPSTENWAGLAETQLNAGKNFDATGWLVPVYNAAPGQPSHALTNDTGAVIAYVSGLPGMNLDRYRNQAVGIGGLRGYNVQLQSAHIQAQSVTRIR